MLIEGTAADLNFARWQLDWTRQEAPGAWSPVAPPETAPVIDGRFTTWVPPEPGSFLVRLTAEDRAGNRRSDVKRVYSPDTPSITDLYLTPRLFSPNGDGVLERVTVHYRVLQPVHLEFRFTDLDGTPVRTISRDHSTIGSVHEFEWDGRDDAGITVPDGDYRMTVQSYEFFVTVDNTPPEIDLFFGDFERCVEGVRAAGAGADVVVDDRHFDGFDPDSYRAELGEGADPLVWHEFYFQLRQVDNSSPPRSVGATGIGPGLRFRLHATDRAGNQALATTPLVSERFVNTAFGRHAGPSGDLASLTPLPCGFATIALEHGPVRFAAAESLPQPVVQVAVEFQPVPPPPGQLDEQGWFATPV
ncbi:MAG: hypothetical protein L0221_02575, partial [Chloroflexi bacterium]|nr:hypothetical protein [Chloroflexota bacterium]